ncbi:MAG: tetratricopeptide repeat protein, partial [Elusimicrobiota bacterium]|nr:tetratricopeptide repeat protein [Elusimicrobiota bacterium]
MRKIFAIVSIIILSFVSNVKADYFNLDMEKLFTHTKEETNIDQINKLLLQLEEVDKDIKLNPDLDNYYKRGCIYYKLKNYSRALADFNKVIVLDNHGYNGKAYYYIGYIKYQFELYEQAIKDFDMAIELNLNDYDVYIKRGSAKLQLNLYEEGLEDINKALAKNPNDIYSYRQRGIANFRLKKYKESIADFNKILELDKDNIFTYLDRAMIYFEIKDYKKFIEDIDKVIKVVPIMSNFYYLRGMAKKELELNKEAILDFHKSIEMAAQDNTFSRENISQSYLEIAQIKAYENLEDALEYFDKSLEYNPNNLKTLAI